MHTTYKETINSKVSQMVLFDRINDISNLMHRDTLKGGANIVEMTSGRFNSLENLIVKFIASRYKIMINDELSSDTVTVYFNDELKGEIKFK